MKLKYVLSVRQLRLTVYVSDVLHIAAKKANVCPFQRLTGRCMTDAEVMDVSAATILFPLSSVTKDVSKLLSLVKNWVIDGRIIWSR